MSKITTQQLFDQYVQMNQKLESMEQKLDSVIEDNSVNTRLTGSIAEKSEVLIERGIRSSSTNKSITVPYYAKGVLVFLVVRGLTGTFSDGEGYQLRVINGVTERPDYFFYLRVSDTIMTRSTESPHSQIVMISESIETDYDFEDRGSVFELTKAPLAEVLNIRLELSGSFEQDEGLDCELIITWLR